MITKLFRRDAAVCTCMLAWIGFLSICSPAAYAAAPDAASWVLSYEGKSTNRFVWDRRTQGLVRTSVPAAISDNVLAGLGGPPNPVIVAGHRYVSVSACVPHDCGDKSFFWIDSQTGVALGASLVLEELTLGSTGLAPSGIPVQARRALADWLSEEGITPSAVKFVDVAGRTTRLPTAQFQARPVFQPPPAGPSFDCAAASTGIEQLICRDADLAKLDLDLADQAKRLRHGHDTVGAREQVTQLQREWLRQRDANCTAAADAKACLMSSYQRQHDVLWHWIPK